MGGRSASTVMCAAMKPCLSAGKDDLPFWAEKKVIQEYLEKVNGKGKVRIKHSSIFILISDPVA